MEKLDQSGVASLFEKLFSGVGLTPARRARMKLGDKFAAIARPVAQVLDATLGTNLQNCKGCPGRQAFLNGKVDRQPSADFPS